MIAGDFLTSDTGDILIKDGDLVLADATKQHQRDLLLLQKGELKSAPTAGVGIFDFLDDENPTDLMRAIRRELTADGMTVNNLVIETDGSITIDAEYEDE